MGLSRYDLIAQPLPDGFEWVYGCWENPRTGDCYIIGKDGIRENEGRIPVRNIVVSFRTDAIAENDSVPDSIPNPNAHADP